MCGCRWESFPPPNSPNSNKILNRTHRVHGSLLLASSKCCSPTVQLLLEGTLSSCHHSINHDVCQRISPLSPGSHALRMILQLAVPLFRFAAIFRLVSFFFGISVYISRDKNHTCSRENMQMKKNNDIIRMSTAWWNCSVIKSTHTYLENERFLRENLLHLEVVLPVVLGANDAPVQVEWLPEERVAAVLFADKEQRGLADAGVAGEAEQLCGGPVRFVAGTWLVMGKGEISLVNVRLYRGAVLKSCAQILKDFRHPSLP